MIKRTIESYNDIINLSRPASKHPKMDRLQRAAQFLPFAALNGYEESIQEESRLTMEKVALSEDEVNELNKMIASLNKNDLIYVTYYIPDELKLGGSYSSVSKEFKKIENNAIFFTDKTSILIENIIEITKK